MVLYSLFEGFVGFVESFKKYAINEFSDKVRANILNITLPGLIPTLL
jgi:hypothetical protein